MSSEDFREALLEYADIQWAEDFHWQAHVVKDTARLQLFEHPHRLLSNRERRHALRQKRALLRRQTGNPLFKITRHVFLHHRLFVVAALRGRLHRSNSGDQGRPRSAAPTINQQSLSLATSSRLARLRNRRAVPATRAHRAVRFFQSQGYQLSSQLA